ncbi:hypothetical protein SAMN05421757_110115 [Tropicimonas sediminicola]|uniref:Uncharacterized protein n=1 Tax=Tropicimonas sediminicola TaxID=1031541 RepID=A0A239LPJ9_9RHOB|nr:hypothetical protein SAMN05421757_110115 [Tropicimonas sediminicola]
MAAFPARAGEANASGWRGTGAKRPGRPVEGLAKDLTGVATVLSKRRLQAHRGAAYLRTKPGDDSATRSPNNLARGRGGSGHEHHQG